MIFTKLIGILTVLTAISANDIPLYKPTWSSLDKRPLPAWYDNAKVGIFIHWGVYSVPTMGDEWFWKHWKNFELPYVNYVRRNFKSGTTYQDIASDFTAEHFDADEWANLFKQSGANYVVLTSKHHDGYALWPSKYSFGWNSVDIGPGLDIIYELSKAVRKNSMKFGLYHSLFEWYNPMYVGDKRHLYLTREFVQKKIEPELRDLVISYRPDIVWSDGDWEAPYQYWQSREFLAWLYNESPVNETVVTNDRWGLGTSCKHGGFYTCGDRYNPGTLQEHKWENAMTIDRKSWGNRANAKIEDFMTSKQLIDELVITVSCGGNILVNVGPTKSGIIEPIYVDRLMEMGKWLKINGEAIYDSKPWKYQNDSQTPGVWYTTSSTRSIDNNGIETEIVYAIILNYPYDDRSVLLFSFKDFYNQNTTVRLLGYPNELRWTGFADAVQVYLPPKSLTDPMNLHNAWTLKIETPIN